ncbi:MAG: di-trans,poly-cis-decaprenylcistransferase [Candidatus Kerfeldbacteria bacterium]|nr:di-trans,poly-cis-decaprenylcistransferase [Candidatus Kerfeldbacteria bacterium]
MTLHHNLPQHVAIIMDGNRRWARKHRQPAFEGHRAGYRTLKRIGDVALERGIKYLTVWAFSTENWHRAKREVQFLLNFVEWVLREELVEFHRKGVHLVVTGRLHELSAKLQKLISDAMNLTRDNTRGVLNVLLNYGGRAEIVDAVRAIVRAQPDPDSVNAELIASHLYHPEIPNPDLIIRTSGELRLSGLMPWQAEYSELIFVEKLWPDFTARDFDACLAEFARRDRRFGTK